MNIFKTIYYVTGGLIWLLFMIAVLVIGAIIMTLGGWKLGKDDEDQWGGYYHSIDQ